MLSMVFLLKRDSYKKSGIKQIRTVERVGVCVIVAPHITEPLLYNGIL